MLQRPGLLLQLQPSPVPSRRLLRCESLEPSSLTHTPHPHLNAPFISFCSHMPPSLRLLILPPPRLWCRSQGVISACVRPLETALLLITGASTLVCSTTLLFAYSCVSVCLSVKCVCVCLWAFLPPTLPPLLASSCPLALSHPLLSTLLLTLFSLPPPSSFSTLRLFHFVMFALLSTHHRRRCPVREQGCECLCCCRATLHPGHA